MQYSHIGGPASVPLFTNLSIRWRTYYSITTDSRNRSCTGTKGDFDLMRRALDLLKSHDIPAGIGGHRLDTIRGCVDHGLKPDFWMKTLHRSDYPSYAVYHPCDDPDATIAYMQKLEEPWIAFKVLAQGAIHPKVAFPWCFKNGADFLCVGMFDFELVENVNLACDVLAGDVARSRPWRG